MKNKIETVGWITVAAGLVGLLVFTPVITFGLGWIGGWLLKLCVGSTIADGMNLPWKTRLNSLVGRTHCPK